VIYPKTKQVVLTGAQRWLQNIIKLSRLHTNSNINLLIIPLFNGVITT
jgi:hypothetical protein